ncbi:MAG: hypothetical protein ACRDRY_02955 [Pseudonocardiaceae bacterium]
MTDDEFWALLLHHPDTAGYARALRRDPAAWQVVPLTKDTVDGLAYEVPHLYLDMPVVNSRPLLATHPALVELPTTPWACRIIPPDAITEVEKERLATWRARPARPYPLRRGRC